MELAVRLLRGEIGEFTEDERAEVIQVLMDYTQVLDLAADDRALATRLLQEAVGNRKLEGNRLVLAYEAKLAKKQQHRERQEQERQEREQREHRAMLTELRRRAEEHVLLGNRDRLPDCTSTPMWFPEATTLDVDFESPEGSFQALVGREIYQRFADSVLESDHEVHLLRIDAPRSGPEDQDGDRRVFVRIMGSHDNDDQNAVLISLPAAQMLDMRLERPTPQLQVCADTPDAAHVVVRVYATEAVTEAFTEELRNALQAVLTQMPGVSRGQRIEFLGPELQHLPQVRIQELYSHGHVPVQSARAPFNETDVTLELQEDVVVADPGVNALIAVLERTERLMHCGYCASPAAEQMCRQCTQAYCSESCQRGHWLVHQHECTACKIDNKNILELIAGNGRKRGRDWNSDDEQQEQQQQQPIQPELKRGNYNAPQLPARYRRFLREHSNNPIFVGRLVATNTMAQLFELATLSIQFRNFLLRSPLVKAAIVGRYGDHEHGKDIVQYFYGVLRRKDLAIQ